jgi:N-ethylmaleimide reductase
MLFDSLKLGSLTLKNRVVMAPMTRSRAAENNTANALMAEFYAQRASAGLLITEGTAPSPDALGYPRIPGVFDSATAAGWRLVAEAVHAKGGAIFLQLMHTGRVGASLNLPAGARVVSSAATVLPGEMYTDAKGMQPHATPHALTDAEVDGVIEEFVTAAKYAREAGMDGVEIHGANGYLVEQFLNANLNTRTDRWGGSAENRNRFAVEIAKRTAAAIGADRVGIRLSPYGVFNHMGAFDGVDAQYESLTRELSALGIAYVHLLDHSAMGAPPVPAALKKAMRAAFQGVFILAGGFDRESAEATLAAGGADLIAFARPFIANPDLVARMRDGKALAAPDASTFYTPGPKGYTDYPTAG